MSHLIWIYTVCPLVYEFSIQYTCSLNVAVCLFTFFVQYYEFMQLLLSARNMDEQNNRHADE